MRILRADLHLHTTASDGELSPGDLLSLAARRGLDCIAITDHDTTAGVETALQLQQSDIQILTGLEFGCAPSTDEEKLSDIDILAYDFDPLHPGLHQALKRLREHRKKRGKAIISRLRELGVPIQWHDVSALAAGESIGRPHIAQALLEFGYVSSYEEAFERYLRKGAPAYVPRWRLTEAQSIALIHDAGGVAVIAHPGKLFQLERRILALIPHGLDGIEIIHPQHNRETTALLRRLAQQHDLLMTGGSDFHRPYVNGEITMGRYLAPPDCIQSIQSRSTLYRP